MQQDVVNAIITEIKLQQTYLHEAVSTIYFGGGTPSILPAKSIENIISQLHKTFNVVANAEVTLEANPDDITTQKLLEWRLAGINRLSIGVQSFFREDLLWMNRAHNELQAESCIDLSLQSGFTNLTIDLIYGTPTLTDDNWKANVDKAIAWQIPHISCYALTVEPQTALDKMISQNKMAPVDPEKQARHFELLMSWLAEAGYEHYEISNFARPGHRSLHNSSYWQGLSYLGLGPSAHSFNGASRQWNVANNALYIKSLQSGTIPFEIETLTHQQQLNEYIMTSLRTMEGISLASVAQNFGQGQSDYIVKAASRHLSQYSLQVENNFLKTTAKGKLLADGIAADLFVL